MRNNKETILLVGDNPFHGISHLSQERARSRGNSATLADNTAKLVLTSLDNGAEGFMFSVSDETLAILRAIREKDRSRQLRLFALVPYAYEYVRLATQLGGFPGLAKKFAWQLISSRNFRAIFAGLKGIVRADIVSLLKAYLQFEISRVKSSVGKQGFLDSILLHEVITDMALALELDWLFKSFITFMSKLKIRPGFETRNFTYLARKFEEWNLGFGEVIVAAPFNKIGFLMNPSRIDCERALTNMDNSEVIAMSILAAGSLKLPEATAYLQTLPNIKNIVVGVSKEQHARETFSFLREKLK